MRLEILAKNQFGLIRNWHEQRCASLGIFLQKTTSKEYLKRLDKASTSEWIVGTLWVYLSCQFFVARGFDCCVSPMYVSNRAGLIFGYCSCRQFKGAVDTCSFCFRGVASYSACLRSSQTIERDS